MIEGSGRRRYLTARDHTIIDYLIRVKEGWSSAVSFNPVNAPPAKETNVEWLPVRQWDLELVPKRVINGTYITCSTSYFLVGTE
jgi:hypothetical protein